MNRPTPSALATLPLLSVTALTACGGGSDSDSAAVLAVYFSVDGTAIANGRPSDARLSPTVVKAQNAKPAAGASS
ncbi:hypothetical protein ACWEN4_03190 [Streptomyces violaceorubidus]